MHYQGICQKMQASLSDANPHHDPKQTNVQYHFVLDEHTIHHQIQLGQSIHIHWTGNIYCVGCGAKTSKSFSQGYCFKCFKTSPETDLCIMKPETCHYHQGTCRDNTFAHNICFQPHIVYLANSSGLKVGITRIKNQPSRWLDQGAMQALPILSVGSRRLSGQLETLLATELADKTNWQRLLKGDAEPLDLLALKDNVLQQFSTQIQAIKAEYSQTIELNEHLEIINQDVQTFHYPILQYPSKIKSHNLDKTPDITGVLQGIKGQYLILDTGVINLRKYSGYELILTYD